MKLVTKLMIDEFKIKKIGYDFMGYSLQKNDRYTFHHLIVPVRNGGPTERWNGAILCGNTSHPYLHIVEGRDLDLYKYITNEMIDMNIKGYLDIQNIIRIDEALCSFEREYSGAKTRKGKILIKEEYTKRLLR